MSTREDVKTFFGLPLDFSMLELEPETDADPVRYFCTPENAEIIGWGSCGTHFVLLPGDEAVYCVEPELAEEGTFVLPVGADFREFLSHLNPRFQQNPQKHPFGVLPSLLFLCLDIQIL